MTIEPGIVALLFLFAFRTVRSLARRFNRTHRRKPLGEMAAALAIGTCAARGFSTLLVDAVTVDGAHDAAVMFVPFIIALEGALGSFAVLWIFFRKGRVLSQKSLGFEIMAQSALLAAALWFARDEAVVLTLFSESAALAISYCFLSEILFSLEWRLALTPVPKPLRGEPILAISAGLLGMGLLGLSGLY